LYKHNRILIFSKDYNKTMPAIILLVFLIFCVVFFVVSQQLARNRRPQQPLQRSPGVIHGSMGRMGEPMPPAQAAQAIYGNLQSRGGLQQGRVYSASYFQSLMPGPVMGFSDDWIWWNAVFASLNDLLIAGEFGFPCYAYNYGGQPCLFFGALDDPMMNPVFYNDPMMDTGSPFAMDPSNFVMPDSQGFDGGDQMGGVDPNMGPDYQGDPNAQDYQADPNSGQDFGSQDDGGGFDSGGGFDDGGGFDGGGSDS
jgi:uncharacterized membrane protein YgcG